MSKSASDAAASNSQTVVSTSDGVRETTILAPPQRRWPRLLAGAALIAVALVQLGQRYVEGDTPRADLSGAVPAAFAGMPIALEEAAPASAATSDLTLRIGDQRFATSEDVWRDAQAPANDWQARYNGRYRVAGSDAPGSSLVIVELLREHSDVAQRAWRTWVVTGDGDVDTAREVQPARQAEAAIHTQLYGRAPERATLWPPAAGLILGSFLFLSGGLYRRPASWPSVALVSLAGTVASVAAWPVMLHIGLGRTLPGVMIGAFITACVAALLGRRAQGLIERGRLAGYAAGVAFAGVLFMVFVNVYVTVGGFVAPVFRVPGEIVSPMDLLVADYVAPAIGLIVTGLLPALLAGAVFAWWRRR